MFVLTKIVLPFKRELRKKKNPHFQYPFSESPVEIYFISPSGPQVFSLGEKKKRKKLFWAAIQAVSQFTAVKFDPSALSWQAR